MQSFVPVIFHNDLERVWQLEGRGDFVGLQTRRPVLMLERAWLALCAQQANIGRRIVSEYKGSDVPAIPYWQGEDLNGARVAYLHDGLLGDECIHTAVYAQLRRDYPQMDLHVFPERFASENYRLCSYSRDAGYMGRNRPFAFTIDQALAFDYWITPVNVGWECRHRSEKTQYELLEEDLGIRIEQKTPYLYFADIERQSVRSLVARGVMRIAGEAVASGRIMPLIERGDLIVIQLNASEAARSPDPALWVRILTDLRAEVNDLVFVMCGSEEHVEVFKAQGGNRLQGVVYSVSDSLSQNLHLSPYGLLYYVERARLALTPDSFLMHAAAAYDVPTVALWQDDPELVEQYRIPSPRSRIRHYGECEAVGMSIEPREIVERILRRLK